MIYDKAICIICFLILILEISCIERKDRIVSGSKVKKGKYPFMASIQGNRSKNQFLICGGTVLRNTWVLTAAHCIIPLKPSNVSVFIGSNVYGEGDEHSVEEIYTYPKYDGAFNDIGLIKLKHPISQKKAERIGLNKKKNVPDGITATIIGWGKTSKESQNIPDLREVKVKTTKCNDAMDEILRHIFGVSIKDLRIVCTATDNGAGACKGDSGGPLIYKSKQIGIISRGEPCATGTPDVFTNVAFYVDWIEEVMDD